MGATQQALVSIGNSSGLPTPTFFAPLTSSLTPATGSGSATFARATVGTVWGYGPTANPGDAQVLLTCASGEARFGGARRVSQGVWSEYYADGTPIPAASLLGIYMEDGGTNGLRYSSTFQNAAWSKYMCGMADNNATGPDGTTSASKMTVSGNGDVAAIYQAASYSAGAVVTLSVFAKAGTTGIVTLILVDGATLRKAVFNATAGSFTSSGSITSYRIKPLPNGWYRFSITATLTNANPVIYLKGGGNNSSGETLYWFGAQVETGVALTSHIPTTSATVTRNADVLSFPVSGNLGANDQTLAIDWTPYAAGMGTVYLMGSYVDANNSTAILHDGTNIIFRRRIAGTNYDATKALAYSAGTTYKVAARMSSLTGGDVFANGVIGTNNATTTAMQLGTPFEIGSDGNGGNQAFGHLRNVCIFNTALTSGQLSAITMR